MNHRLVCVVFGLAVVMLVTTGFGQDQVFPNMGKVTFSHDNEPVEPPGPTALPIEWLWHPAQPYQHVAGIKFSLKYDPYEVEIVGLAPAPLMSGIVNSSGDPGPGFSGHIQWEPPQTFATSEPTTTGGLPDQALQTLKGTVWVPRAVATNSGINIVQSHAIPFLDVTIQSRHSSSTVLNSDVDVLITDVRPIIHLTGNDEVHLNSVWIKRHVETGDDPSGQPISTNIWDHQNSIMGYEYPVSQNYYPGPLPPNFSSTDQFPISGIHATAHIEPSDFFHADETVTNIAGVPISPALLPSDYKHADTLGLVSVSFPNIILHASDYIIGTAVATTANQYMGLGVDHIPEPASLTLLGLGGFAALMRLRIRRRRRRAA